MFATLRRLFGKAAPAPLTEADRLKAEVESLRSFGVNAARRVPVTELRDGVTGMTATFTYVDRQGVITDRHITKWRVSGAYIVGHCSTWQDKRMFRKDRIADWQGR